jgi:hypothetical protein
MTPLIWFSSWFLVSFSSSGFILLLFSLTKIINYVQIHQGCLTEEAFEGVRNDMSRSTFFKGLSELIKGKEIRVENSNMRDRRLYPYNNLLISVPEELKKFECCMQILLDKGQKHIEALKRNRGAKVDRLVTSRKLWLLRSATIIFFDIVSLYNAKALFIWTKNIREPEVLNNLYLKVFVKINDMRNVIVAKYQDLLPDQIDEICSFMGMSLIHEGIYFDNPKKDSFLHDIEQHFSDMGLRNEFLPIKNHLNELTKFMFPDET